MPVTAKSIEISPGIVKLFERHLDRRGPDECWEWRGGLNPGGYGRFQHKGRTYLAHRVSITIASGDPGPLMQVDHICRNRRCSNPAHLRVVDARTNTLENSLGPTAYYAAQSHCTHGHELSEDNIYWHPRTGARQCRQCRRAAKKRARVKARAITSREIGTIGPDWNQRKDLSFRSAYGEVMRITAAGELIIHDPEGAAQLLHDEWLKLQENATPLASLQEQIEQIVSAWAFAHDIDGAARNDLFRRLAALTKQGG